MIFYKKNIERWFTLIEVLIVIVIIWLIIIWFITWFNKAQKQTRDVVRQTNVLNINKDIYLEYTQDPNFLDKLKDYNCTDKLKEVMNFKSPDEILDPMYSHKNYWTVSNGCVGSYWLYVDAENIKWLITASMELKKNNNYDISDWYDIKNINKSFWKEKTIVDINKNLKVKWKWWDLYVYTLDF